MISFRYHLVTIVAIFAGLAVGVVAGSTVVDRTLLENTRQNLETTNRKLDEVEAQNNRLKEQNRQLDELGQAGPQQFLAGRLSGVPVVVVEGPNVRSSVRDGLRRSLETAGATVAAEVALDPSTADDTKVGDIADVLGLQPVQEDSTPTSPDTVRAALGAEVGERLRAALTSLRDTSDDGATGTPAAEVTTTTIEPTSDTGVDGGIGDGTGDQTTSDSTPGATGGRDPRTAFEDEFSELEAANLIDLRNPVATELSTSQPFLTVVLTDRESDADATPVLESFLSQYTGAGDRPLTVAAEAELATPRDGAPASLVDTIGRNSRLRDLVSTVDNAALFTGWAATVLAAENLERTGQIGHFGITGSDGLLPEAPS
jgi:hypothetical protein